MYAEFDEKLFKAIENSQVDEVKHLLNTNLSDNEKQALKDLAQQI